MGDTAEKSKGKVRVRLSPSNPDPKTGFGERKSFASRKDPHGLKSRSKNEKRLSDLKLSLFSQRVSDLFDFVFLELAEQDSGGPLTRGLAQRRGDTPVVKTTTLSRHTQSSEFDLI